MSKDFKAEVEDWKEAVSLKMEKEFKSLAEVLHFLLQFYKENKDGGKAEGILKELQSHLLDEEDVINRLEKKLSEAREACSAVSVIDVPEEFEERIKRMILEKDNGCGDRNEEAKAAWTVWLNDYDFARKNFGKLKVRGKKAGDELNNFELLILGDEKTVLGSLLRHGFAKRQDNGKVVLAK